MVLIRRFAFRLPSPVRSGLGAYDIPRHLTRVCTARTTPTTEAGYLREHSAKEWSSYLPDGRPIRVRRVGKDWQVVCEHATEHGPDLRTTMRAAARMTANLRSSEPARDFALRKWIERHAEKIERESA